MLQHNVWKYGLYHVFWRMSFFLPVIVLFWQDNGLSLTQIMVLQSLFAIACAILEVPTGYVADVMGRKHSLVGGGLFYFIGYIIYSLGTGFWSFLAAELVIALAVSLISGADSAFIYETLADKGRENEYKKVWGTIQFYGLIAIAVSNIIGSLIATFGLRVTLYAMLPSSLAMFIMSFTFIEPHKHKEVAREGYIKDMVSAIKYALINSKSLRWTIIYGSFLVGMNNAVIWLYQPYFSITGLDIAYFGAAFASYQLVAAFASKIAHRYEELLKPKYTALSLLVMIVLGYVLMGSFTVIFGFAFGFLMQLARGIGKPVFSGYINALTFKHRATTLSLHALLSRLIYAMVIPVLGWIADVYTIQQALLVMAASTAIIGIVFFLFFYTFSLRTIRRS